MSDEEDLQDEDAFDDAPIAQTTVDVGSPSSVRKRMADAERIKFEDDHLWRSILSSPVGRRIMWGLIAVDLHTFNVSFACGPNGFPQPESTWFQAGEQAFGLKLYHKLMAIDRDGIATMHEEHDVRFAKPEPKKRGKQ